MAGVALGDGLHGDAPPQRDPDADPGPGLARDRDRGRDRDRDRTVEFADEVYIGRQAVLDANGQVMGYELLYRRRAGDRAAVTAGSDATLTVVSAAMVEFGLEHIVRDGVAFVNVTRDFLAAGLHRALPAERVVLEVLEDEIVDDTLVDLLGGVRAEGYRLALDDYTPDSAHHRLLGLVDTVKIDMLATPRARLAALVDELRSRRVTVLAEKVETYADLHAARALGVDLVQGFFFHRPEVLAGRRVAIGQLPAARLLATIDDPGTSARDVETVIACDPGLTHRLLRLASSPAGTARPVATLRAALVLLGRQTIKNLALVAMMHGVDGKTSELATTALVRAKTCEQLAARGGRGDAATAFLVGLLSVFDAVFDTPLAALVEQLPLSDEVAAAVVAHDGRLGALLDAAIAYERADVASLGGPELGGRAVLDAYVHAVGWADLTMRSLAVAPPRALARR
ncbi:MAG TPA: HDOD domain-containing protein [Acidimicrobiales bacterium]|nr:HDOD domain-containing protein [Acidimicrobiales bacterium]